jgi:hypothetical protein
VKWKKSSFSNGTGGSNCVEVVIVGDDDLQGNVYVRDSKENGSGIQATLAFTRDEWSAFIKGVKNGEFDI